MPYLSFPARSARPFAAALFAAALAAASGAHPALARGAKAPPLPVEALIYSTMPCTAAHSPVMALDGDPNTFFESAYGMGDGDSFEVRLSQAIPVQSLQITTGDTDGDYLLSHARAEVSADDVHFTTAAAFDAKGVAQANLKGQMVSEVRIVLDQGTGVPALAIREIALNSSVPIAHVQRGPGRGEQEYGQFPELAGWEQRAEAEMEAFWPDTEAMLYTDKFIPPNLVHVIYRSGPNVTGVAATGGGVMTVNADYARQHPDDTALTVHEDTHVVQSYPNYNPVWLVEGIADYVRWVKYEPDQFPVQINPAKATYHDSYRTSAAFLGWCCLHYDSGLVTKLNRALRFNDFQLSMFKDYCGKDVDTLWAEFIADYQAHPKTILTPLVPAADQPRVLPAVTAGSSAPADLSGAFNAIGLSSTGAAIPDTAGVDGEGNTYDAKLLGVSLTSGDVTFDIGPAGKPDMIAASGQTVALPSGQFASLWLLGTGVEGAQTDQTLTVTYTDGTTAALVQNFSDWYQPGRFVGEFHAIAMPYRLGPDGQQDMRPFNLYRYGFALDATKTVKSLTLPNNAYVKIFAISLAK